MKAKTIQAVLRKKTDEWLATIEDEELRERTRKSVIVTGGCIASMLLKEMVNDYDVYFDDKTVAYDIANYYVEKFKELNTTPEGPVAVDIEVKEEVSLPSGPRVKIVISSQGVQGEGQSEGYQYFETLDDTRGEEFIADTFAIEDVYEKTEEAALNTETLPRYRPVFLSTNAITLSNKIQLVLRFIGKPKRIHKFYDFVHCTNYWRSKDGKLVLKQPALESLLARELRYVGSLYPVCSLIRLRKFIKRNWTINAGQIVKMAMQVSELDLTDPLVLEDQLTGVDVAYFMDLVRRIKDDDPQKVNAAYIIEIIDRMF